MCRCAWVMVAVIVGVAPLESGAAPACAEPEAARIASADLRADASVLRRALEELHPGLYRYNTREQVAAHFAALDAEFERDLAVPEAFLALSRFAARVRCGHTFLNPRNQSKAVAAAVFEGRNKLPLAFRWIDGRMIVERDLSGATKIAPGTEVVSINGVGARAILERLMTVARADGSNDGKRASLLGVSGLENHEAFDVYFPLLFPLDRPEFDLVLRPTEGAATENITVAAMTEAERMASRPADREEDDGSGPLWAMSYLPSGAGYLRMRSWVAYKTTWDWVGFINSAFDELIEKQAPALVIDLRGNEGGSSVGDVILARLVEREVPSSVYQRFVRYRKTPEDLNRYLDTWDDSFRDWGESAVGPVDGLYRLTKFDEAPKSPGRGVTEPSRRRYTGRVFVIVDASNSSATFEFALAIKEHGLGTLVGQTTGGNQRGINGGAFFFLRLPKSGLELDLPLIAQFPTDGVASRPDTGVTPDVVVRPRVSGQADPELEAVERLIGTPK